MLRLRPFVRFAAAMGLMALAASAQVLWKEPAAMSVEDWVWGPGGKQAAPQPPYTFLKENLDGTNPKIDVKDAAGRTWVVKFGSEIHSDTFAARFVYAMGYATSPAFFVPDGNIAGVQGLKRAKVFVAKDGSFRNARFKLHERHKTQWSWVENPFLNSQELGGLKVVVMLLSNWDTKDARDPDGGNNGVFEGGRFGDSAWFAVTDWGASLGKSGGYFQRDRWDWRGYSLQTASFASLRSDGTVQWGFRGKHGDDIVSGVGVQQVRWILPYLARVTDEQLMAAMTASGATPEAGTQFTRAIRQRIQILQRIAAPANQEITAR